MAGAQKYFEHKERCVFCDIVTQETRDGVRVIYENAHAVALSPWAPRSPFETWVVPRFHASHFEEVSREVVEGTADCLRRIVRRLDRALERPPYNFILHSGPLNERSLPHYHWHIELVPTLTRSPASSGGAASTSTPRPRGGGGLPPQPRGLRCSRRC